MTEEQRKLVAAAIGRKPECGCAECLAFKAYRAEYERMRQFIRNLADESRVYLESEE